ncbi:winged helix DNA-binding protein [Oceanivirga miroungae]|uniref:MarR family transcriptional regulator n=1 Tax=Oceanivirga miroungae TaxID=1130046 RepID=A0A6I8M6M4_9FUSO|nr:winged helix DNA-binding protein [Oceanivirga miroungae]VWL85106.1 MarR family transcriptional regulator [Oceanivirga miroungae]
MIGELENLIRDFNKSYQKLEQLNLDNTIKCLTQNEIYIIRTIADKNLTVNELNEYLETTVGTTSLAITKLEKKKFIERKKDKIDKRKVYVSLSEKGKLAYNVYDNVQEKLLTYAMRGIEDKEKKEFCNTFSKLIANLKEMKKMYAKINLSDLNVSDVATIDEIKLSYAGFKYLYEKGIAIGKEVKVIDKTKNVLTLETFKGKKNLTTDDAKEVLCIKRI